jgi:hypothetical protein
MVRQGVPAGEVLGDGTAGTACPTRLREGERSTTGHVRDRRRVDLSAFAERFDRGPGVRIAAGVGAQDESTAN